MPQPRRETNNTLREALDLLSFLVPLVGILYSESQVTQSHIPLPKQLLMVVIAELKFMCVATFYVSMNFVPFIIPFLIYQAYALDS